MTRDFTKENYEYFCRLIDQINQEDWCGVTDWFGDRYLEAKHWFGEQGFYDYTKDLEKYYKELLDKKNTSKKQLKKIFENVSSVDTKFASDDAGRFGYCLETLKSYQEYIQTLNQVAVSACSAAANGGKLSDCFNSTSIRIAMHGVSTKLNAVLTPISFSADTFGLISEEYKKEYVQLYEESNPEQAKLLDQVLSDPDLTEQEKLDIRFLIYTAPEPYRTIYLQHIDRYKVVVFTDRAADDPDKDKENGSFYRSGSGKIYLVDSDSTFRYNPRGPYNTFFHESGHALDDYENKYGYMMSRSYEYNGQKLNDLIRQDVTDYVSDYIDEAYPNLTPSQKEQLMCSLNLSDDADYTYGGDADGLSKVLQQYREEIVDHMSEDLYGEVNEAASDVYGGITNNALIGSYGHIKGEDDSGASYTYWYCNGTTTNSQTSELWAEFFAAQMTHDYEALASIKEHFPQAYDAMEAMAREMASS